MTVTDETKAVLVLMGITFALGIVAGMAVIISIGAL